ncbi:MAG: IS21-like element helper ATPase IstB [Rubrobacteraceae bacterium]
MSVATDPFQQAQREIEQLTRRLRMPYIRKAAPEVLATARSQRWDSAEALKVLLEEEARGRDQATISNNRRRAGFPSGKTFESWQQSASSIPVATQQALMTLEWVGRRENLCVCGPSGTGKSHYLEGLSNLTVDRGMKVSWFSLEDLGALVRRYRADDSVAKAICRVCRADLIVVDDIGLLPVANDTAEGFYRLVDAAYEKRSLAISSNVHPAGFDELIPKNLAGATVDRLMHHAHVVVTEGESYRLTEATAGRGVMPLS